ncbi:hypothetical protein ACLOJK_012544 [Asimina triloba]
MERRQQEKAPHVVIFPFPAQGHINSFLGLARLLCLYDFRVTFLNSDYNHDRLLRSTDIVSQAAAHWPGFQFKTIPDGLPPDHPRTAAVLMDLIVSLRVNTKPLFKEMLTSYRESDHPVTCVIADGFMSTLTIDVADEVGIPILAFRTVSACSFWCYFNIPKLIDAGEIPFGGSLSACRIYISCVTKSDRSGGKRGKLHLVLLINSGREDPALETLRGGAKVHVNVVVYRIISRIEVRFENWHLQNFELVRDGLNLHVIGQRIFGRGGIAAEVDGGSKLDRDYRGVERARSSKRMYGGALQPGMKNVVVAMENCNCGVAKGDTNEMVTTKSTETIEVTIVKGNIDDEGAKEDSS